MKILCTADWHIGKKLEAFSRLEEQKIILNQLVAMSAEENSDAVIVAGDCFDTQSPSPEMTKLFVSTLARLSRSGECLVLVIAGNHDNPLFLSTSEAFASQVGVVILGYPSQEPSLEENNSAWKVTQTAQGMVEILFKKAKKTVRFLMSPYANAQRLKKDLGVQDTDKKAWEILCEEWQKNIAQDPETKNILISHSYLLPAKKDSLIQDEAPKEDSGERSIVGTLGGISLDNIPEGIDYVIAGHIHRPQSLYSTKTKAFYTGSPLIYSLSESGQEKSVLILDIGRKDKEYLLPFKNLRDVKEIRFDNFDTIGELLEQEKNNYLVLIWEGDRYFTSEEHQYLRNTHPYLIRIESRPKIVRDDKIIQSIETLHEQSTTDLFIEYFRSKNQDLLPAEDLLSVFDECLQEESTSNVLAKKRGFLPKNLKIKGFYSYKEEVEIDFTELEQKGFFGIFGNTGSGKSALIEAMIIAVFYKVERFGTFGAVGKGNFSNSYGIMNLDSNELLIEFIFEIIGVDGVEEYLCRVSATRDKKKHTEVKIKREVFLKEQEEWIPSEISLGEDIVGITYDDFRKTIILQQRDFLGFVSSAPKENTETLMRLFQLERFDLYYTVDRLGQKEFNEFKTLEVKLQNFEDTTDEALEELNTQKTSLELERIALDERIETQRALVTKLTQQLEQQQKSIHIQEKFAKMQSDENLFNQAREHLNIIPLINLDSQITKKEEQKKQLALDCQNLQNQEIMESKKLDEFKQQGTESTTQLKTIQAQVDQKQQEWDALSMDNIAEQAMLFENRQKDYKRVAQLSEELAKKITNFKESIAQKDKTFQELTKFQLEEKKIRDLLGLGLALEHLQDGCACPLCGSEDHPSPYKAGSADELQEISAQVKNLQEQYLKIQQQEESLKESLYTQEKTTQQLKDILGEYADQSQFDKAYNDILAQKLAQEKQKTIIKEELQTLKDLYKKLEIQTSNYREQHLKQVRLTDEIAFKLSHTKKEILQNEEELIRHGKERVAYLEEKQLTEKSYATIKEYPQKTELEINTFFTEFLILSGEMKNIKTFVQDHDVNIENEKNLQQSVLQEFIDDQNTQLQQLGSLSNKINNIIDGIATKQKLQEQYDKLVLRKNNIELLKKLFKSSGFVHFIGQKYLNKLCYTANKRFLKFTQNQFELSAPDALDDKKGRIVVIDRLSGGTKRDMLTLSGGQSFQAALALALALADESGTGHRFFFIDEGFGTLDDESLYVVLDTLRELAEEENRVVGIISHVQMIKEEVMACLNVELDKNKGTQVSLVLT